jgi:hypothetical protein
MDICAQLESITDHIYELAERTLTLNRRIHSDSLPIFRRLFRNAQFLEVTLIWMAELKQ